MRILWSDDMDTMIESAVSKLVGQSFRSYSDFQSRVEPPVEGTLQPGGPLGLPISPDGTIEIDYRWIAEIMAYFKGRLETVKDDVVLALADIKGYPEEWKSKIAEMAIDDALEQVDEELQSYMGQRTTPAAVMQSSY